MLTQWIQQNSNTTNVINVLHFISVSTGWSAGDNGLILNTTDGGNTWLQQNSTTNHNFNSIYFINQLTGYSTGTYYINFMFRLNIILKTTSGGQDWDTLNFSVSFSSIRENSSICFFNGSTGIFTRTGSDGFTSQGDAFRTTNGGASWSILSMPSYISYIKVVVLNSTTAFLLGRYFTDVPGRDTTYVFKTTNTGSSWQEVYHVNNNYIQNICAANDIVTLTGYVQGSPPSGIIFKSSNQGANWSSALNTTVPSLRNSFFINNSTGWAVGSSGTIIYTTDSGLNWSIQLQNQSYGLNDIQMFSPCTGFTAGSTGKILKTTNCGLTSIVNINWEIPSSFSLSQNYPNPFNPITNIKYQVPKSGLVKLLVYDLLGSEVQTLVNRQLSPGTYEVDFDGSNLPSGVYYYKLETGEFTQTKKMVLIK